MARLRLLDAFCRKGGAGFGYMRAGFDVIGVDIEDHADGYPGEFVQGDAVEYIREHGGEFDVIHTSPPCQGQIAITQANRARDGWTDAHENLIPVVRELLAEQRRKYGVATVIENGPSRHLRADVTLCGLTFGLPTFRHRAFEVEAGGAVPTPVHVSHRGHLTIGYRHRCRRTVEPSVCPVHRRWCRGTVYGVYGDGGGKPTVAQAREALGIDWMSDITDLNEAVPPAYTEWLGRQLSGLHSHTGTLTV